MTYKKHNFTIHPYEVLESGAVQVPEGCEWVVRIYDGEVFHTPSNSKGQICLILEEAHDKKSGFWPIMNFLSLDEAANLADQLHDAVDSLRT